MALSTPEDILIQVRNCFCEILAAGPNPPSQCCVVTYPVIAECCSGIAWVRAMRAWPAQDFPRQDVTPGRCTSGAWAMQIEVGVARCAPEVCDVLGPQCCESELDVTMQQMDDFNRMRSLQCCLVTPGYDGIKIDDILPGAWAPEEPQGGCTSSAMTFTIRWSDGCGCA